MTRGYRSIRRGVSSIVPMALLFGAMATPAPGAPTFGVQLSRDAAIVKQHDERVDYTVSVTNTAPPGADAPQVPEELTCADGSWSGEPNFSYQWIRNGVPLESAADIANGSQTKTYESQPADAGEVVQCLVRAENLVAKSVQASNPPTVVAPQPAVAPPTGTTRPTITPATALTPGQIGTCTAPSGWTGTGIAWQFEWLSNGQALGPANVVETTPTTSRYQVQAADSGKVLQCEAIAEDATGRKALVISRNKPIQVSGADPSSSASLPSVGFPAQVANDTSGPVTLVLELPGGSETYVYETEGSWSCGSVPPIGAEPAKALCTRSDVLEPGSTYPGDLKVIAALGGDLAQPAVARATVGGGGASASSMASDEFSAVPNPFGLTLFETGVFDDEGQDYTQAGAHPFSGVGNFVFASKRNLNPAGPGPSHLRLPIAQVKQVFTDLPRGLVGNALAVPELCPSVAELGKCPPGSVVGGLDIQITGAGAQPALYAIEPEFGTPAQFAFADPFQNIYTISTRLRAEDNYAISLDLAPAPQSAVLSSLVTICGFGAKTTGGGGIFDGCREAGEPGANPKPLFTNPTRCAGEPPRVRVRLTSWQHHVAEAEDGDPANTGCEAVQFTPSMALETTTNQADSPTGLDVSLTMPTEGLQKGVDCHEVQGDESSPPAAECVSQANLKRARITFPEGMAVNASAGHGLGSCSADQVKLKTNLPHECPDSSKIGTIEIETPLIQETLTGAVYIAKQGDVDGALIGLYLVFESKKDGIIIKVPARVDLNPKTGQLVTIVDESPEAPFSAVRMHFPGGPMANLLTPSRCGTYEIKAELSSWAAADPESPTPAETVTDVSTFEVTEGPNGGPCPDGRLQPNMKAGSTNLQAGAKTAFVMRLDREDGTQRFTALELTPPPGLVADLRNIPYCPDSVLASISGDPETGKSQIANPSCPAASLIGTATAGAGAGPNPFYVETGKVYLAGPYKGGPLSIAVVTPAVAGPLDLGSVVVRNAIYINPATARITVVSDPIPTILHGILLDVRDIRVAIDRPNFTQNPTNCEPMSIDATVTGDAGGRAAVSNRFQVDGCGELGFKPRISLRLKGGTKRGDNPALTAVVRPRPGDANIARAAVTLPRSAFLDQAHIRTICTRVQFAADNCPKAAIYGRAEAVTPLLDYALKGPVYLRSSDNELPDLVADLRGPAHQPIKIEAAFRTDSIRGGIRSTIDVAPDAPVTKFTLRMQGGKKGLVVNSRNLCARINRANARMVGQNGRRFNARPKVVATNCKKRKRGAAKSRASRRPRG